MQNIYKMCNVVQQQTKKKKKMLPSVSNGLQCKCPHALCRRFYINPTVPSDERQMTSNIVAHSKLNICFGPKENILRESYRHMRVWF